jgi:hypothetical protein
LVGGRSSVTVKRATVVPEDGSVTVTSSMLTFGQVSCWGSGVYASTAAVGALDVDPSDWAHPPST